MHTEDTIKTGLYLQSKQASFDKHYIDINGLWPSATYTKRNNFILLVIKVPWKDILTYFNFVSGVYAVIGIIACFIPEPTVSKALGAVFGISSLVLTIILSVLAEKKAGQSIRIGFSFNYKITSSRRRVYIVKNRWLKVKTWVTIKSVQIYSIKWWVRLWVWIFLIYGYQQCFWFVPSFMLFVGFLS